MQALPDHPTERDRERFRDAAKQYLTWCDFNRTGIDGEYKDAETRYLFKLWWSVECELKPLEKLNQSQGAKISELLARAEKAEAELAKLREQKPLTWGTSGELMDILKNPIYSAPAPVPAVVAPAVPEEWRNKLLEVFPLFDDEGLCQGKHHCEWALQQDRKRLHALLQSAPAAPGELKEPAVAAPAVPNDNWRRFTDDDLAEIHELAYELGGTDSGQYLLDGEQLDQIVVKCASLFYAFPVKAATAVPEEWLKCWLIESPASSEWPAVWLTITTDGRRWVSDGGTMYSTGGDWYFTAAASEALKFADKESADEYVRHNKIKGVVVTEHIFDNRALLQSAEVAK